jgi:hypothetical protein
MSKKDQREARKKAKAAPIRGMGGTVVGPSDTPSMMSGYDNGRRDTDQSLEQQTMNEFFEETGFRPNRPTEP